MTRPSSILIGAAILVFGGSAWAHGTEINAAALRFEKAALQMQHFTHAEYGERLAHRYRHTTEAGRPARRARRDFARLARGFHDLRDNHRRAGHWHHGTRSQRAFRRLHRAFHRLVRVQRREHRYAALPPAGVRAWDADHGS